MKQKIWVVCITLLAVVAPIMVPPAQALSCLSIEMYFKDIAGKDGEVVIFTGTSVDRFDETAYTAEVITIDEVKQGYIEEKVFVYHQKDETWGYLCNNGPKEKGSKGLYVATKDAFGKYNVHQRLEVTDPLVKTLDGFLKEAEIIPGEPATITAVDRRNQIMTTISDVLREVSILLKEYLYWK